MHPSQPVPKRRGLRQELDDLELLLIGDGDPLSEIRELAGPERLDFLFRLELAAILRAGPAAEVSPRRLLVTATRAAEGGALPLATVVALRRTLRRLTERLYAAGAWHPARPMWWSPLPEPMSIEELWRRAGGVEEILRSRDDRLTAAFGDTGDRWLGLPELVPASLVGTLHGQLEAAHDAGALDLERAGVGADGRISSRRGDSVLYLDGTEPELLAAAPAFAALAQWCLAHLADHLTTALPEEYRIYPPAKVMLARYPAPSVGYRPHLDNPGGDHDNGRTLTLVVYLNAPARECNGGEIVVWHAGASTSEPPAAVLPAASGSGVLFDARAVAHQVRPVQDGPARWAMALWLSDSPIAPSALAPQVPELAVIDALLPIEDPPLAPGKVLFHELEGGASDRLGGGEITVHTAPRARPRVGIVTTVYRGGAALDAWCDHHMALGIDHLVLVFDRLEDPAEAADAERLAAHYPRKRLTVWPGAQVAERWGTLSANARGDLERYARSGAACWAVAARQTLNAGVALETARGDALGGAPLDWLLHLDADELLFLEGAGRGGASVHEHFTAAAEAGLHLLRYTNHELLNRHGDRLRFKRNPHLAAARLGATGWSQLTAHLEMAQTDPRPYFTGYFNGKSAVAVAHGTAAAGVHGWRLEKLDPATRRFLAGPSILHLHFPEADAFRHKYLAAEAAGDPPDTPLFEPSPVEVAAFERIRSLRREGADEVAVARGLDELHRTLTTFSDVDVELLEAAGLIFEPALGQAF